jgi:hypothetical protein
MSLSVYILASFNVQGIMNVAGYCDILGWLAGGLLPIMNNLTSLIFSLKRKKMMIFAVKSSLSSIGNSGAITRFCIVMPGRPYG